MKPPILIHAVWTLLAAGAYFAGTFHPRGAPASAASASTVAGESPVSASLRKVAAENRNAKDAAGGKSAEDAGWVNSFRGSDGVIAADRMAEAVEAALRDPDPVMAMFRFSQLMKELTPENAAAALKVVAASTDSYRYLGLFAHAWGLKDGKSALASFDSLSRRESEMAKTTALAAWTASDPDAAMKWLKERSAPKEKDAKTDPRLEAALSRGMVMGLARRDVGTALNYLMTLTENDQENFVGLLVEQKMKEGIAAGAEWAETLPNKRMQVTGMEIAGGQYLRKDLDGAMKWAERIASRPEAHEAVADVANEMANRNGQEAVAWVAKLPPGPSQNHAFEDVFETWTRTDPLAASQSLANMTPGPGRDTAIEAFSGTLARENPADALTWAGSISDEKQRVDLQLSIARRWQANAPAEARAWIAANLPPEVQARALAAGGR